MIRYILGLLKAILGTMNTTERWKTMGNSTFTAHLTSTDMSKIHSITLGGYQSTTVCPPQMTKDFPGTTSPHQLFLASIGAFGTIPLLAIYPRNPGRTEVSFLEKLDLPYLDANNLSSYSDRVINELLKKNLFPQ